MPVEARNPVFPYVHATDVLQLQLQCLFAESDTTSYLKVDSGQHEAAIPDLTIQICSHTSGPLFQRLVFNEMASFPICQTVLVSCGPRIRGRPYRYNIDQSLKLDPPVFERPPPPKCLAELLALGLRTSKAEGQLTLKRTPRFPWVPVRTSLKA